MIISFTYRLPPLLLPSGFLLGHSQQLSNSSCAPKWQSSEHPKSTHHNKSVMPPEYFVEACSTWISTLSDTAFSLAANPAVSSISLGRSSTVGGASSGKKSILSLLYVRVDGEGISADTVSIPLCSSNCPNEVCCS